jgi:flagella basal body P-ring formation protein FlgA
MIRLATLIIFLIVNASLACADILRGSDIIQKVEEWGDRHDYRITAMLDPNRAFYACQTEPSIKIHSGQDLNTIVFTCNQKNSPWHIYVRTKLKNISRNGDESHTALLVSAANPIKKGSVINVEDLVLIETNKKNIKSYFGDIRNVEGRKAKRTIYRGQLIKPQHVTEIWTIEKDQMVVLINKIGRIRVEASGIALESGQKNDIIKVRNITSGEIISGIVQNEKNISVLTKMN